MYRNIGLFYKKSYQKCQNFWTINRYIYIYIFATLINNIYIDIIQSSTTWNGVWLKRCLFVYKFGLSFFIFCFLPCSFPGTSSKLVFLQSCSKSSSFDYFSFFLAWCPGLPLTWRWFSILWRWYHQLIPVLVYFLLDFIYHKISFFYVVNSLFISTCCPVLSTCIPNYWNVPTCCSAYILSVCCFSIAMT